MLRAGALSTGCRAGPGSSFKSKFLVELPAMFPGAYTNGGKLVLNPLNVYNATARGNQPSFPACIWSLRN